MKELLSSAEKLADEELKRSYKKFSVFNSSHEGYAVIAEEVEEHEDDTQYIRTDKNTLWDAVKKNDKKLSAAVIFALKRDAIHAAAEAIQVAAMAQKFIDSGCAGKSGDPHA
jgi:hypothetical protein